jgi:hypothetical protein
LIFIIRRAAELVTGRRREGAVVATGAVVVRAELTLGDQGQMQEEMSCCVFQAPKVQKWQHGHLHFNHSVLNMEAGADRQSRS